MSQNLLALLKAKHLPKKEASLIPNLQMQLKQLA